MFAFLSHDSLAYAYAQDNNAGKTVHAIVKGWTYMRRNVRVESVRQVISTIIGVLRREMLTTDDKNNFPRKKWNAYLNAIRAIAFL